MKKLTTAWVVGLGCALALSATADETKKAGHEAGGATKSATGCLERGVDANTFKLTHVAGGGDWQLVGDESLKLSDHVGHKVEVSGMPLKYAADQKEPTADEKGVSSGKGSGANVAVDKKEPTADEKGISSGKGTGAKKMKDQKMGQLKVTAMKHVAGTCP